MNRDHYELKDNLNRRTARHEENKRIEQMEIEGSVLWWAVMLAAFIVACLVMAGILQ